MTRLREEILGTIGSSRRPTYDDFKNMKYMRAIINGVFVSAVSGFRHVPNMSDTETLRLFPPV
jgi:hypothetical protein